MGLNQKLKIACTKDVLIGLMLSKLLELQRITDRSLGSKLQPPGNFCDFLGEDAYFDVI